jgi:large subunit ribosomal protein L25
MEFLINAEKRETKGTSSSRNTRRLNLVPAIIYGAGSKEQMISLNKFEVNKHLESDGFYSQVLDVSIDGTKEQVILRDIQRHPAKQEILHIDFQRIRADQKINVTVPVNFINEEVSPGVKVSGGIVSHLITELEIICLPKDIPENITVDMVDLELDHPIHLKDLTLPTGVELTLLQRGDDGAEEMGVVVIHMAKAEEEEVLDEAPVASEVASDQKNDESNEQDKDKETEE